MAALPHSFKAALALTLLHSVWQVAVLALLAAALLALQSSRSAATRHVTGLVVLLAMVTVPALTFANLLATHAESREALLVVQGPLARAPAAFASVVYAPASRMPLWLPWAWSLGVLVMLLRLCGGWWMVRALDRKPCDPLPAIWRARADALRQALGIRREVAIRLLRDAGLPCSAHAWRPVIWLPVSMLSHLSAEQIEALIAHELAHVRRLDWIWNGLQCVAEALLFYHPGMWWLSRRIRQERENACDDLAVAACGDAIVLAEALSSLERLRVPVRMFALSAKGGVLMQRIKRLLLPDSPPHRPRLVAPLALLALACSGALFAAQVGHPAAAASAQETPHWWNTVGHAAHIVGTVDGHRREYHQWVDFGGHPHESYLVDDQPAPIDAQVRQWLAVAMKPPAPPVPPAPPPPPPPPVPPTPPVPPPPPRIEKMQAFTTAVALAEQDARVQAMVGSPSASVAGPCYLGSDAFDCTITLTGSRGIARLQVEGERHAGRWQYSKLRVMPEHGEAVDVARHE